METGLTKAVKAPLTTSGVFVGLVKRVNAETKKVWVQIGRLAGLKTIGPLMVVGPVPSVGHRVACQFMENGELVVLGTIQQVATAGPIDGAMIVSDVTPTPEKAGQQWLDTTSGLTYVAVDNGTGTLVWIEYGSSAGGGRNSVESNYVSAQEATTSTVAYVDLATVGPTVTMETGHAVRVTFGALMSKGSGTGTGMAAVLEVSGATTIIAGEAGIPLTGATGSVPSIIANPVTPVNVAQTCIIPNLNLGENTIRMVYASSGTLSAQFANRYMMVERID